jgi:hypothetical protein
MQIEDTVHESYKLNLGKRAGVAAVLSCLLFVWRLTGYGDLTELMWPITLSLFLFSLSRWVYIRVGSNKLGSQPPFHLNGSCFWTQDFFECFILKLGGVFVRVGTDEMWWESGVTISSICYLIFWTHALISSVVYITPLGSNKSLALSTNRVFQVTLCPCVKKNNLARQQATTIYNKHDI